MSPAFAQNRNFGAHVMSSSITNSIINYLRFILNLKWTVTHIEGNVFVWNYDCVLSSICRNILLKFHPNSSTFYIAVNLETELSYLHQSVIRTSSYWAYEHYWQQFMIVSSVCRLSNWTPFVLMYISFPFRFRNSFNRFTYWQPFDKYPVRMMFKVTAVIFSTLEKNSRK